MNEDYVLTVSKDMDMVIKDATVPQLEGIVISLIQQLADIVELSYNDTLNELKEIKEGE